MKNLIVMAIMSIFATSASAGKNVLCTDRKIQDAHFVAKFFDTGVEGAKIELSVPTGESSAKTLSGICFPDQSVELAITCSVITSTDSGYQVRLFSAGGSELKASVTAWSMAGMGKPTILPCDKN
ncbi:MAG: hypothetical protein AABY64_10080 [Bdellovibrionota bacterium]